MKKIEVSEPIKKHLRVIGFLLLSSSLAYLASVLGNRPEYMYLAPVINYAIYAVEKELGNDGVIKTMLRK